MSAAVVVYVLTAYVLFQALTSLLLVLSPTERAPRWLHPVRVVMLLLELALLVGMWRWLL